MFSRCKDAKRAKAPKLVKNEPATSRRVNSLSGKRSSQVIPGEFSFPTIVRDSRSVRFVNCAGGTWEKQGRIVVYEQKDCSVTLRKRNEKIGTYNDDTRPAPLHHTPIHIQNCVPSRATGCTEDAFAGTAARRERHVSHGYTVGSLGASSMYCIILYTAEYRPRRS